MDLATIIGLLAGFGLLGAAIFSRPGGNFFLDLASIVIVLGGTLSATLMTFPMKDFLGVINVVRKAFMHKAESSAEVIEQMVELSRKARVEGLLALEKDIDAMQDLFVKKGLQLMVDGTESVMLRDILSTELSCLEDRHNRGQNLFKMMATYAPAFGMAGTLIGLIQMLQQLSDPSKIGAGMATALVTTLYGVILANLVFIPIAGKLKTRSEQELNNKELVIEGICAIQAGDNPRLLRDKLVTFIAPNHRPMTTD